MNEKEIVKDLIRAVAFFGIVKGWGISRLKEVFEVLEVPLDMVNETLNEGANDEY